MVRFIKDNHTYTNNGKVLISVTQLLAKHGLAPDYSGVSPEVLEKKAERGTLVHAEIEAWVNKGEPGFTKELSAFIDYISEHKVVVDASEFLVANDIVAGTADLLLDQNTIADIKTTSTIHKESVSWQLSLYAYLYGRPILTGQVFHFDNNGKLEVVDIPLKPIKEVEALLQCEREGKIYKQEINFGAELQALTEVQNLIINLETQKNEAEKKSAELKKAIMGAMEAQAIIKYEDDKIRLNYISAGTRTSLDSKRLKAEKPEIYEAYTNTTNIAPSLRIAIKNAEIEEK